MKKAATDPQTAEQKREEGFSFMIKRTEGV